MGGKGTQWTPQNYFHSEQLLEWIEKTFFFFSKIYVFTEFYTNLRKLNRLFYRKLFTVKLPISKQLLETDNLPVTMVCNHR